MWEWKSDGHKWERMKTKLAKKKTAEKASKIDNILFNCRDILRAARNSGSFFEKRDMMLTLVFLRFIGEEIRRRNRKTPSDFDRSRTRS